MAQARGVLLGHMHPMALTSADALGRAYEGQGNYAAAKQCLQRTLELRQRTLWPGHFDSMTSTSNLGKLYSNRGHFKEAEALLLQVRC